MRIAVCDDCAADRQALCLLLRQYFGARSIPFEPVEFDSGEALAAAYIPHTYALVFCDVYMQGMTGVEAVSVIRKKDRRCTVIFTTMSKEHGADAFDLDALYYLLKPVDREKLFKVLDRWLEKINEVKTLELKNGKSSYTISAADIVYAEVQGRVITVHTEHGEIKATETLSTLKKELPSSQFCQPIRYCLVALKHIVSIGEGSVTLSDGSTVPLSRRERDGIKEQLADYRLNVLRRR